MNTIRRTMLLALAAAGLGLVPLARAADEAPDALVKRISQDVLDTAKADKQIQAGNRRRIDELVQAKIVPHVNFEHMTELAAGPSWQQATPEQKKQLVAEFSTLLIHTYAGAISQVTNQQISLKPMRGEGNDVEVRTEIVQPRGEPIQLYYRLEKLADGWKIYDISILGAWVVDTYKGSFAAEIGRTGIDGLIKVLAAKNKSLAGGTRAS